MILLYKYIFELLFFNTCVSHVHFTNVKEMITILMSMLNIDPSLELMVKLNINTKWQSQILLMIRAQIQPHSCRSTTQVRC
jgi:hypothetical protein